MAGTYKSGFGFFPLLCFLPETGQPLAGILRPGNAGANTAVDQFEVLQLRLSNCPPPTWVARSSPAPTLAGAPTPSRRTAATQASASRRLRGCGEGARGDRRAGRSGMVERTEGDGTERKRRPAGGADPTASTSPAGPRARG